MPAASAAASPPPVHTRCPFLPMHDRGAGVLAHRQHLAGGDVGILEEIEGDEAVVGGRLGIVEDGAKLAQMGGTQEMRAIDHRLLRQKRQRRRFDHQHGLAGEGGARHVIGGEPAIGRLVLPQGKHVVKDEIAHPARPCLALADRADKQLFPETVKPPIGGLRMVRRTLPGR